MLGGLRERGGDIPLEFVGIDVGRGQHDFVENPPLVFQFALLSAAAHW